MTAPTPEADVCFDDEAAYAASLLAARPEWQRRADDAWEAAYRRGRGQFVTPEPPTQRTSEAAALDAAAHELSRRRPTPQPPPPPRAQRMSEAHRPGGDAQLDAARRRHCAHRLAADPDPYATTWPREIVCLNCAQPVDAASYDRTPGSALRSLRASNEGRAAR